MPEQIIGSSVQNLMYVTNSGAIPIAGESGGQFYGLLITPEGNLITETSESVYTQSFAINASNLTEYIGKASPNSNKAGSVWQIQKITYNSMNAATDIQFASGTSSFVNIWSGLTINYTTYPYS